MDNNDKRLERIEMKLDDVADHMASIDVILGQQHISLKEHIRRTSILEQTMVPVKRHVDMMDGAIKLIIISAGLATIVTAVFELAKLYFKV